MSSEEMDEAPLTFPLYVAGRGSIYTKWVELGPNDVLSSGLSFETKKRIAVDADVRIVLSGVAGLRSAYIQGRVTYRKKLAEGRYRVGIELQEFVNVSRDELLGTLAPRSSRGELAPTPTP